MPLYVMQYTRALFASSELTLPSPGTWRFTRTFTDKKGGEGRSACACWFFAWQVPGMTARSRKLVAWRRLHCEFSRRKNVGDRAQSLRGEPPAGRSLLSPRHGTQCSRWPFLSWGCRKRDVPAALWGLGCGPACCPRPDSPISFLAIVKYGKAAMTFSATVTTVTRCVLEVPTFLTQFGLSSGCSVAALAGGSFSLHSSRQRTAKPYLTVHPGSAFS